MDSILGSFPNLNDFLILWFCPKDTRICVSILLLQTRGGCSQQPSSLHTSRGLRGKLKAGRELRSTVLVAADASKLVACAHT